jgi:hypothetical protein
MFFDTGFAAARVASDTLTMKMKHELLLFVFRKGELLHK